MSTSKPLLPCVGMQHRPNGAKIASLIPEQTPLLLQREPHNLYDPNAIKVLLHIGYVSKEVAKHLALLMDSNQLETLGATLLEHRPGMLLLERDDLLDPQDPQTETPK